MTKTWNYRLIRRGDYVMIHEVHYDDGEPFVWTEEAESPGGNTPEDVLAELAMMRRACELPVLEECVVEGRPILREVVE